MRIPTERLVAEHRDLPSHAAELRTVDDRVGGWDADTAGRTADVVGFLSRHLAHAHAEKNVLCPAVEHLLDAPGATATMVADHHEIVARLDRLDTPVRSFGLCSASGAEANEVHAELYRPWAVLELDFRKEEEAAPSVLDAHPGNPHAPALFERMGTVAYSSTPAP